MHLTYSPLYKLSDLCIEEVSSENCIDSMYLMHDTIYKPTQIHIANISDDSTSEDTSEDNRAYSEAFLSGILEELSKKLILIAQYTCCWRSNPDSQEKVPKKEEKKKISFANPEATSVMSDSELEIVSSLNFDSLEVPESPIVDPDLGTSKKPQYKHVLRKLFAKEKSSRHLDEKSNKSKADKCSGQCIRNGWKNYSIDTAIERNSSVSDRSLVNNDIPNAGDGPQTAQRNPQVYLLEDSKEPKRQKRAFDFFNEIYRPRNNII